eukprot:TRINITY_DN5043_c0_g1_i1.p1 TRINITY_DN5043_c0_g1~~TRINITY_DN5043_c0_g1_i1.p1  ORF type:complete len:1658 (+),score=453.57 TRINITY_DN5043_c0_g1_i1:47-5020(+)
MFRLLAAVLLAASAAAQFPTPPSPAIPATIAIAAESTCGREYTPIQGGSEWVAGGNKQEVNSTMSTFTIRAWGDWYMYLKYTATVPTFKKGMSYSITFDMKLSGEEDPNLAFEPQLVLFKQGMETTYTKDVIWPKNYTQDKPENVIGGVETPFTKTDIGSGWFRYEQTWTSQVNFDNAASSIWVRFYLSARPTKETHFSFTDFCLNRNAESKAAPPTLPSFSEKFVMVQPPAPPAAELTSQTACPWTEPGLVTWEAQFGAATGSLTIPGNTKVVVGKDSFVGQYDKIEIPDTSELIFKDEEISLQVRALLVKGKLRIGAPTCRVEGPVKITFWGTKGDPASHLETYGSKGMAAVGSGEIDMFGRRFYPTWARLARKARAGDDRAYLQQSVNWYPGQEVVLTTTIWDDTDVGQPNQNEVMTIKAVSPDGMLIQFESPLQYAHYAGTEYQGEVGLLSRHVMMEGVPDAEGYGGHTIVAGSRGRFAGVATRYMGQTNTMARYPFHFHLLGAGSGSFFSDNVARDTYFRCFVIHGTHEVLETENVAFNATGNCFYVEDGVEENNTVSYNLAAYVKPIGAAAAGGGQSGEVVNQDVGAGGLTSGQRIQPVDSSAAGFYFSNSYNDIIGNVASGGWSGFGFPGLGKPIGEFQSDTTIEPRSRPFKRFYGNTAHSSGAYWSAGGCIYVGGELSYDGPNLKYMSGRAARSTRLEKEPGLVDWKSTNMWMKFENTLVYACNKGLLHWGNRVDIDTIEFHDISRSVTLFGEAWLGNAIVNGVSGNDEIGMADLHHDGFQFYDISVKSVITDTEFRNYQKGICRYTVIPGKTNWKQDDKLCSYNTSDGASNSAHNNIIWSGPFHSDEFKPQQISAVNNIKYTNVDPSQYVSFKVAENGASRFFNFIDFDGSATGEGRPTILGSNKDWWNVCDDCRFESLWMTWLCPKKPAGFPEREVAFIKLLTPDIAASKGGIKEAGVCNPKTNPDWSACDVGYIALWGHGPDHGDALRSTPITQNAGITGITGTGWFLALDGGAAKHLTLNPSQVPNGAPLRFAATYPSGTTFTVTGAHRWNTPLAMTYTLATDLADLWANPHTKYFFDGENFYMMLKKSASMSDMERYERSNTWVYDVDRDWTITVQASCTANGDGFCSVTHKIPAWTDGCPTSPAPDTPAPETPAPDTTVPTAVPTNAPDTAAPTGIPTGSPVTAVPTAMPTGAPDTVAPTAMPTGAPSTAAPTAIPTSSPDTTVPTASPTNAPDTAGPTAVPTTAPDTGVPATTAPATAVPTGAPSTTAPDTLSPGKTAEPTAVPTTAPDTAEPTAVPTTAPDTTAPTAVPTTAPNTAVPTATPTSAPSTAVPTATPTSAPSTAVPTATPTAEPTGAPATDAPTTLVPGKTAEPTAVPTTAPDTAIPTGTPTLTPTAEPTGAPKTEVPATLSPGDTAVPTATPTTSPDTAGPTGVPSGSPVTKTPTTLSPGDTASPTAAPTQAPSTATPTAGPTGAPATLVPGQSAVPTATPTQAPETGAPATLVPGTTAVPTSTPTASPTATRAPETAEPGVGNAMTPAPDVGCDGLGEGARCVLDGVEGACDRKGVCVKGGTALEPEEEDDDGSSGIPWWVWLLVALGVLGLGGACAFFACSKQKEEINVNEFIHALEGNEMQAPQEFARV